MPNRIFPAHSQKNKLHSAHSWHFIFWVQIREKWYFLSIQHKNSINIYLLIDWNIKIEVEDSTENTSSIDLHLKALLWLYLGWVLIKTPASSYNLEQSESVRLMPYHDVCNLPRPYQSPCNLITSLCKCCKWTQIMGLIQMMIE